MRIIAEPLAPLKAKRASLTPKERAAMFLAQKGICACGCGKPLKGKIVGEHTDPVALGNGDKPDCLLLHSCSLRKTRADLKKIAKVKHLRLETGQQARRARRKQEGRVGLIPTRKMGKSASFNATLTKGLDGKVRSRKQKSKPSAQR